MPEGLIAYVHLLLLPFSRILLACMTDLACHLYNSIPCLLNIHIITATIQPFNKIVVSIYPHRIRLLEIGLDIAKAVHLNGLNLYVVYIFLKQFHLLILCVRL